MKTLNPLAKEGKINEDANIRDSQSIIINAPIEKVWELVIAIDKWPEWNLDIKVDRFTGAKEGESFKWQMNGHAMKSIIQKINEPNLLTWTSQSQLNKAINVWKLDPAGDHQTIVSAEESIQGFSTLFIGHQKLHNTLLTWLDRLKEKAQD